jgi:L-lactate dehydrogenase (cytochrome)
MAVVGDPAARSVELDAGANWDYLARLRDTWRGTLVVKGVISAQDASRIKSLGIDGVYVSNHGGRQLDAAPATIDALRRVREELGPDCPIICDGGVRSGEDVVKMIAAGANFAMLGRPFLYATGAFGQAGAMHLATLIREEMEIAAAQIGASEIGQFDSRVIWKGAE